MKKFFTRFGIKIICDKPTNNLIINVFLCIIELIYFVVSVYNLYCAQSISGFTIALNCLSFLSLILLNFRTEHERSKTDERYSLYFFLFAVEFLIALILSTSFIIFGTDLEKLTLLLFTMLVLTILNRLINIAINLYAGE